jgi:toxin ParE1/3/4
MRIKPVIPRELANRDVDEAVAYYSGAGGTQAALKFIDALEDAYSRISRHPAAGSPRYAHELDVPGLRYTTLTRFPHLVFYIERQDHVDVWRLLDGRRDIPAWLQAPGDS